MHPTQDELVLHYYGESGRETAALDTHLAECGECRTAFFRLRQALAMVEPTDQPEPVHGLEDRVWARLEPSLDRVGGTRRWWLPAPLSPGFGRIGWLPATVAATLIVAAFLTGRLTRQTPVEPPARVTDEALAPGNDDRVRTRVLLVAVGDHLERSEMVLSELMNAGDIESAGLVSERARASDLVAASRLYRQTAAVTGDQALEQTLDDLERTMVEIANTPADMSNAELAALRDRIERRGLLFRVRVLNDDRRIRDDLRERDAQPLSKGPTS